MRRAATLLVYFQWSADAFCCHAAPTTSSPVTPVPTTQGALCLLVCLLGCCALMPLFSAPMTPCRLMLPLSCLHKAALDHASICLTCFEIRYAHFCVLPGGPDLLMLCFPHCLAEPEVSLAAQLARPLLARPARLRPLRPVRLPRLGFLCYHRPYYACPCDGKAGRPPCEHLPDMFGNRRCTVLRAAGRARPAHALLPLLFS